MMTVEALQKPTVAPKLRSLFMYNVGTGADTAELLEAKEALKAVVEGRGAHSIGI